MIILKIIAHWGRINFFSENNLNHNGKIIRTLLGFQKDIQFVNPYLGILNHIIQSKNFDTNGSNS